MKLYIVTTKPKHQNDHIKLLNTWFFTQLHVSVSIIYGHTQENQHVNIFYLVLKSLNWPKKMDGFSLILITCNWQCSQNRCFLWPMFSVGHSFPLLWLWDQLILTSVVTSANDLFKKIFIVNVLNWISSCTYSFFSQFRWAQLQVCRPGVELSRSVT